MTRVEEPPLLFFMVFFPSRPNLESESVRGETKQSVVVKKCPMTCNQYSIMAYINIIIGHESTI